MTDSKDGENETTKRLEDTRREVLAKTGRLAVYTAPTMTTLLGATKARAAAVTSPVEKI